MSTEIKEAQIAISDGKIALFGSRMGYCGPVVQDYVPFEDEASAIAEARARLEAEGYTVDPEISRPYITSMRVSYSRRK
jgi:hypothetical protein